MVPKPKRGGKHSAKNPVKPKVSRGAKAVTPLTAREGSPTLADLNLTDATIADFVRASYQQARRMNPSAPKGTINTVFYLENVGGLRESLDEGGVGWKAVRVRGLEMAEDEARGLRIGILRGDAGTGTAGPLRSASPRGGSGRRSASVNTEQLAFAFHAGITKLSTAKGQPQEWYLVLYRTPKSVRAELSMPTGLDAKGHYVEWAHRIPVAEIDLNPKPKARLKKPPTKPSVNITRKKGNSG